MLHEFISLHRSDIIERCRTKVAARSSPTPTELEINHGVPLFLDQLVNVLRRHHETSGSEICQGAALHGQDLRNQGFTVGQVVHGYGDVCQSITEIAIATNAPINTDEFRTLNKCLDDAIADAVTAYEEHANPSPVFDENAPGNKELRDLIHELRNLVQTATVAFGVLERGNVGVAGSTAAVLRRSLGGLQALVEKSIEDVRLIRTSQDEQQSP